MFELFLLAIPVVGLIVVMAAQNKNGELKDAHGNTYKVDPNTGAEILIQRGRTPDAKPAKVDSDAIKSA